MIAYNKTWLTNMLLQAEVKKDLQNGCITHVEFKNIAAKYPLGFYSPNIFVRIGLFILMSFGSGLLTLMFASSGLIETSGWFFFLGLLSYGALEFMVHANHHFRSGVDDALGFIAACLFDTGFCILLYHSGHGFYLPLSGFIFLLNFYFAARFADMFMSAVCCIALFAFAYFGWTTAIPGGLATVPFALMLASGGVYWLTHSYNKRAAFINYRNCLIVAQLVCLVTLYASGNYYVIQTLSDELHGNSGANSPVPFGAFFWVWTIGLPLVYVSFGIKKKDVILLRTGLLLIVISVLTFRTYYHILPTDVMLVIAGTVILGIAYGIMKYLKTPKHGFTYEETNDPDLMDHLKIESLLVAETFSTAPVAPADSGAKFGGGDFGGGGSSSNF